MFIHQVASGRYLPRIDEICATLEGLNSFLKNKNLLAGFEIKRPPIIPDIDK
jgi:hypothetical protein